MPKTNIYASVIARIEREIAELQQELADVRALAKTRQHRTPNNSRGRKRKRISSEARQEFIAKKMRRGASRAEAAADWKIRSQALSRAR